VSGFHRSTTQADVTWVFSLASVLVVDLLLWQGRRGRRPGWRLEPVREPWPRPGQGGWRRVIAGVSPWLALAFAVLAWELLGIDTGTQQPHLTISALTLLYRPLNAATLMVWMLVGLGYGAARARVPVEGVNTPAILPGASPSPACAPALLLPSSRPAGVAFWLGVVTVAAVIDQIGRHSGGRLANAEELLRFVTASAMARAVLVVAWIYAGYHLFAH
jgi:hypothetical protein